MITSDHLVNHSPPSGMRHPECAERVTLATERVKDLACVDMAIPAAEGEVAVARGEAQGGELWDEIVAKVKKVHDPLH